MIHVADLFCGAGGESTGIIQALDVVGSKYDLAAINHWDVALQTHEKNHPQARHFHSDINHLNPFDVFSSREKIDLLWASPECTHHSNARGGRPRSNQSRASAWMILKWLSELYVRRVILENVPEFENWGPLGADGMPLKSRKGATFNAFISALRSIGYKVEWQNLTAANYGDPTTRKRFFLQASRGRGKIVWPEHTNSEHPDLLGNKPWITARDIIDWSIKGESISKRKRPLAPATLRRIETGMRKYWGEWAEPFIVILRGTSNTRQIGKPLPTVTGGGVHFGLVEPFMVPFYGERKGQEPRTHKTNEPVPTIPASGGGKFGLVEPFMIRYNGSHAGKNDGDGRGQDIDWPIGTLDTSNRYGLVEPFLIQSEHGGRIRETKRPLNTITGSSRGFGVAEPFLVKYYGSANVQPVRIPIGALTTKDRYALVQDDLYTLDITFRMLQPHELAAAQGFPGDYWFAGTKTDQVKQIGNAVPVNTARALALSAIA